MTLHYINKAFVTYDNIDNQNNLSFEIWDLYFKKNTFPSIQIRNKLGTNCLDNCRINSIEENNQDSIDSKITIYNDNKLENIGSITKKEKSIKNKIIDTNPKMNNSSLNKINTLIKENCLEKQDSLNLDKNTKLNKKRRRKRKSNQNSYNKENNLSIDNIIRKCKSLVLNASLKFLNDQISKIYKGDIGQGIYIKKLFDIGQKQKNDNSINYTRQLFYMSLKEIFSANISPKFTSFLPNHNKIVINRALSETDKNKREKFFKIFNLTFKDCLDIFIGDNNKAEFDGFPKFEDIESNLDDDIYYKNKIKLSLFNFENILKNTKPRKKMNEAE